MPKKVVAFFIRHFNERGTEISAYNYAHFNETILGNHSIIIAFKKDVYKRFGFPYVDSVYEKFRNRFVMLQVNDYSEVDKVLEQANVDVYYTQTQGLYQPDTWPYGMPKKVKTVVHCVFNTSEKHGDVYMPISQHLNDHYGTNYPVLPYMVTVDDAQDNLREQLNIPKDAIVYGRHGGYHQFHIPCAKEAVAEYAMKNPNVYFVFLNTQPFTQGLKNVIYLPMTTDEVLKRQFINTCDAMVHGREDGETFGLSVGEFAICKKPIITWHAGTDKAHIDILQEKAILYSSKEELLRIFETFDPAKHDMTDNGYMNYCPEKVMQLFHTLVCQ